jgi:hypothetical protein
MPGLSETRRGGFFREGTSWERGGPIQWRDQRAATSPATRRVIHAQARWTTRR